MTYKFDDEEQLGKTVKVVKPFCKLNKQMEVPEERYIVGDFANPQKFPGLAGRKWSRLCGFSFQGNNGQWFQFVYVPKLKGTLSRNQKALSGWYCRTLFPGDKDNKQVTSLNELKRTFGFDINKFVHSDVFDKYVAAFKTNITYALEHQIKELLSRPASEFSDYKELVRYVNAVKDALAKIDEVRQVVTPENKYDDTAAPDYAKGSAPKVGHAKVAYNADKTYDLRNTAKDAQREELKKRAIERLAQKAAKDTEEIDEPQQVLAKQKTVPQKKQYVKFDPALKYKFGGGRTKRADDEIFDRYDDYENDDFK